MKTKFSKEQDLQLIELINGNRLLYDAADIYNKNHVMKRAMWQDISATMNFTVPDVKMRWKRLRDHYIKNSKNNIHTWALMPHLSFLKGVKTYRDYQRKNKVVGTQETSAKQPSTHNTNEDEEMTSEENLKTSNTYQTIFTHHTVKEEELSEEEIDEAKLLVAKKRKANEIEYSDQSSAEIKSQVKQTSLYKFFESMADSVAQFPVHLAAEAKFKVCQVINDLEIKMHEEAIQLEHKKIKESINDRYICTTLSSFDVKSSVISSYDNEDSDDDSDDDSLIPSAVETEQI